MKRIHGQSERTEDEAKGIIVAEVLRGDIPYKGYSTSHFSGVENACISMAPPELRQVLADDVRSRKQLAQVQLKDLIGKRISLRKCHRKATHLDDQIERQRKRCEMLVQEHVAETIEAYISIRDGLIPFIFGEGKRVVCLRTTSLENFSAFKEHNPGFMTALERILAELCQKGWEPQYYLEKESTEYALCLSLCDF